MAEKAIFAAGCFWGIEARFAKMKGVLATRVGYTGGHLKHPTYEQVCSDDTGHAEAVEVTFDPKVISYEALLDAFWKMHDPTSFHRQGPDVGSQYRSAIFTCSQEQERLARASKEALEKTGKHIATEIEPAGVFYPAEEYHQRYLEKRGKGPSCTS